jgi:hypothetical protein
MVFPKWLARYINDVFVTHPFSVDPLPILQKIYAPSRLRLSRSANSARGHTVFLDVQFPSPQPSTTHLSFGLNYKPGTNYGYSHFNSFVPRSVHMGLVLGGFHRIFNWNSHLNQFSLAYECYSNILKQREYPHAWVLKILRVSLHRQVSNKEHVSFHVIMDFQPKIDMHQFHGIVAANMDKRFAFEICQHPNIKHWSTKTLTGQNNAPEAKKDQPEYQILPANKSKIHSSKRRLESAQIFSKFNQT